MNYGLVNQLNIGPLFQLLDENARESLYNHLYYLLPEKVKQFYRQLQGKQTSHLPSGKMLQQWN